jgi:hypothetical protein
MEEEEQEALTCEVLLPSQKWISQLNVLLFFLVWKKQQRRLNLIIMET